ncbi:MAG: glycosyltransferase family 39 protein [Anaerolineae bacterium]
MKARRAILPITLLAFALRLHNLTYHSLWYDEAVSARWARSGAVRILDVSMKLVEDRLPPLYYLLLKGWSALGGFSEFSLRFPSVAAGVLLVAVVYALGRRLFGRWAGLVAALLAALNPFLIWYSQEARMYVLSALLGTLGALCFVRAMARPRRWGYWAGLGACALAGLYTHLYSGFLWPALAIWLLLHPRRLRRARLPFGLTMGAVSALFLPLAVANWRFSGESSPGDPLAGAGGRAWHLFESFAVWKAPLTAGTKGAILAVLGLFLLAGIVAVARRREGQMVILLAIMPFAIAGLLLLRSNLAFFGERYFIVMLPWLLLLQAAGAAAVMGKRGGRGVAAAALATLVTATAIPVPGQWSIPVAKEAWRQTVAYMTTHVRPEDAVFIHPEWIRFPYQYYEAQMKTPGQTYAYFFAVDENSDLDGPLNGVVAKGHPVIWLIESHLEQPDPQRRVENWFAARYPLVTELYPPGVTLKAYVPGYQMAHLPPDATPAGAVFASGLRLAGFTVFDANVSPRDALFHPPSGWIHVALYWTAATGGAANAFPAVQLVDELGQVWGASLARGNDALHMYPPSRWEGGQIIRQDVDVNLNPATPPGTYRLIVRLGEETATLPAVRVRGE